ncbi:hypothetical protein TSOC_006333, partial [Tetrabaena socialis]
VRFDTREAVQYGNDAPPPAGGGQQSPLPAVLYCTEDGALCRVSADSAAATAAGAEGGRQQGAGRVEEVFWQRQARVSSAGGGGGRRSQVLAQLPVAVNSFDVGGPFGSDLVAVTGRQTLLYMQQQPAA